jgi:GAF domain-containing protein
LVAGIDVTDFLNLLVRRSIELAEAGAGGVIMQDPNDGLRVVGASDERAHRMQMLEVENSEGPCVDGLHQGTVIQALTAESHDRWPKFARPALEEGYRAVASFPMRLREDTVGTLNIFRSDPWLLSDSDVVSTQALADVATMGLVRERALREAKQLAEQLQTALHSRVIIEQAKGMLAAHADLSIDDAFAALRRHARNTNRHLSDVARDVVTRRIGGAELLAATRGRHARGGQGKS